MKYITEKELEHYHKIKFTGIANNNSNLYLIPKQSLVLKMCYETDYNALSYFHSLPLKEGITYPLEIYRSRIMGYESGYLMTYYPFAVVLNLPFLERIPNEKKKIIIFQFFETLKNLHNYIVLGDIHLNNLLVNRENALLCDWDSYRRLDEDKYISSPYYINQDGLNQTPFTDFIKLLISSLSFYFQENLEDVLKFHYYSFIDIFHAIERIYPNLTDALEYLIEEFYQNKEFSNLDISSLLEQLPKTINQQKRILSPENGL